MSKISTHLDDKPYQVAVTIDPTLPVRKWDHKGTVWAVSSLSAAYKFAQLWKISGDAKDHPSVDADSIVYNFNGQYIRVH